MRLLALIYFDLGSPLSPSSGVARGAADRVEPLAGIFASHRLAQRVLLLAAVLGIEALLASEFLDGETLANKSGLLVGWLRGGGAWALRGLIGFAALFATFAYLKYGPALEGLSDWVSAVPIRWSLLGVHFVAASVFAALSSILYGRQFTRISADPITAAWGAAGVAAVVFAGIAVLPPLLWKELVRRTGNLWIHAAGASVAACIVGAMSRLLWEPSARLTFRLVQVLLSPLIPDMVLQPAVLRIGTHHFTAIVSPECSGLEGVGLLLVFGVLWMWLFREESRFPQSLVLLPAGIVVLYLLNAARIAALILIGHAGAREIAAGGFHSQAGWIAFNCVAFGFSIAARRLSWFTVHPPEREVLAKNGTNSVAAYLVPFLTILAAGMISRAASGNVEWLYPLRLLAALGALWWFRQNYAALVWKLEWTAPAIGLAVFLLWTGLDRFMVAAPGSSQMPAALAAAATGTRVAWIAVRVLAAVVTVPLAEELAFRGYLLRRFTAEHFEAVSLRTFTWFPVLASSVIFGLLHGERWLAGTAAGVLYALAAQRRGRLTDAVIAHATTNLLLAGYVLAFDKWYLW